jgi:hypothetical protein
MVETAEDRDYDDRGFHRWPRREQVSGAVRRLHPEAAMGPAMIVDQVVVENALGMLLVFDEVGDHGSERLPRWSVPDTAGVCKGEGGRVRGGCGSGTAIPHVTLGESGADPAHSGVFAPNTERPATRSAGLDIDRSFTRRRPGFVDLDPRQCGACRARQRSSHPCLPSRDSPPSPCVPAAYLLLPWLHSSGAPRAGSRFSPATGACDVLVE